MASAGCANQSVKELGSTWSPSEKQSDAGKQLASLKDTGELSV
jgi:hypothetical protein